MSNSIDPTAPRRRHRKTTPISEVGLRSRDQTLAMVARAVERREAMLAYQPVVTAQASGQVAFYEGLIRVLDDVGRIIPAREFIETVEDQELGRRIDCLALDAGLAALARVPDLRLSINMSARSMDYTAWRATLERWLYHDPLIGERLILEVTEHSAMQMPDLVTSFMTELQAEGIAFALDDFGAGATALRYFKDFQFDALKIDGQFVRGVASDSDNQVLISAMVSIAQQFGMFTVAEFVECAEDAAWLSKAGIDCLQGYYYAAPTVRPPWEEDDASARA